MERVTGIEPALPAWEAGVLPLNYTRASRRTGRSKPSGFSAGRQPNARRTVRGGGGPGLPVGPARSPCLPCEVPWPTDTCRRRVYRPGGSDALPEEDPDGQASPHRRRGRPRHRGPRRIAGRVVDGVARLAAPSCVRVRPHGRAPHRPGGIRHPRPAARAGRAPGSMGRGRSRRQHAGRPHRRRRRGHRGLRPPRAGTRRSAGAGTPRIARLGAPDQHRPDPAPPRRSVGRHGDRDRGTVRDRRHLSHALGHQ